MPAVGRVGLHCKTREYGSIAFFAARLAVSVRTRGCTTHSCPSEVSFSTRRIPLLASPRGGVAERSRKYCAASFLRGQGGVPIERTRNTTPAASIRRLRAIFLVTPPPLLAVMRGGDFAFFKMTPLNHICFLGRSGRASERFPQSNLDSCALDRRVSVAPASAGAAERSSAS